AAVLAAPIGIDRTIEGDVRRFVAGDDPPRRIDSDRGLERRQVFEILPAVVECDPGYRLITARRVRNRAAATPPYRIDASAVRNLATAVRRACDVGAGRPGIGVCRGSATGGLRATDKSARGPRAADRPLVGRGDEGPGQTSIFCRKAVHAQS